jgi:signal transduction histidine kinase
MQKKILDIQLREAGQLTGINWAVWLEQAPPWKLLASYKLKANTCSEIIEFITSLTNVNWLDESNSGKDRLARFTFQLLGLPGSKLYIFLDRISARILLVGSERLSRIAQRFLREVALGKIDRFSSEKGAIPLLPETDLDVPYFSPEVMDRVLGLLLFAASSDYGWLAIRSGDFLEVKANQNCGDCLGEKISIEANPLLREIIQTRQMRFRDENDGLWSMVPRFGSRDNLTVWVAVPLVIGQRLIGLISFWRDSKPRNDEWDAISKLAKRLAPSVEASITFSDLSDHLGRMALLNDFAVTMNSALEPEQIAQRMFALLQRAFGTERISMEVLSPDGSSTQNYSLRDGKLILRTIALDETSGPSGIGKEIVHRIDSIDHESSYQPIYPGSRSALVIPMKFRQQLIGTLGLENNEVGAFTVYDEHLLMVIASNLSGLLENGRLRREAENRARNLRLIHEVIEQIVGLTDLKEVTQIAAELMARYFAYELVVIGLVEGNEKKINVMGIGGNGADLVEQGLSYMEESSADGIVMRVSVTGQSILVDDVSLSPFYRPIPNWDAKSEMCVPLKDADQTIGVVDVESQRKYAFSQNDLLVLESLAGILSSVMTRAGQYQQLQATVTQLRSAREELQERIVAQRMAESRLVQAAKLAAVGEMAAGIAHELNNPLTTVSGFTELVLEEVPDKSRMKNDLEMVLREAQRARSVVRRLLDFARQSESARVRSDINEILLDVLALVNHLFRVSGVQLFTDLSEGLPWISVDRNQMKQVFLNLIHNALHAMPTGGELSIKSEQKIVDQRNWLMLGFSDTGIGIAPENLERVFEPFFTTRAMDGGTGLGLSVTYGIVTDHGGLIDIESEVGKGSKFTVWLPIEDE